MNPLINCPQSQSLFLLTGFFTVRPRWVGGLGCRQGELPPPARNTFEYEHCPFALESKWNDFPNIPYEKFEDN